MTEEEFLRRTLNKIAKEFGYDVASTLELMFMTKEKELDQYKNNWEELKKYLIEESKFDEYKDITYRETMDYVLNKMKELEDDEND